MMNTIEKPGAIGKAQEQVVPEATVILAFAYFWVFDFATLT